MNRVKSGFTIIELTLAMTFISVLLLAIAMTIVQLAEVYNRGLTIGELNQSARTISADISKDISVAPAFSLTSGAGHYVTQSWGGSLCLGQYSYVWNFGSAVSAYKSGGNQTVNLMLNSDGTKSAFNLVRVVDSTGSMCLNNSAKTVPVGGTELLSVTDHDLAVHEFCVVSNAAASDTLTGQQLFTVAYAIGTNDGAALTAASTQACSGGNVSDGLTACKPPGQTGADLQYCDVQEFTLVARAQNAVN